MGWKSMVWILSIFWVFCCLGPGDLAPVTNSPGWGDIYSFPQLKGTGFVMSVRDTQDGPGSDLRPAPRHLAHLLPRRTCLMAADE